MMDCPVWLNDEKAIRDLLARLLKRAYKEFETREITSAIVLKESSFKRNMTGEISWNNLKSLAEIKIIKLNNENKNAFEYPWVKAKVSLPIHHAEKIRQWLGEEPEIALTWKKAVKDYFSEHQMSYFNYEALQKYPLSLPDKNAKQIIVALFKMLQSDTSALTLRELSARFFWGDSKLLESRKDWLLSIFPELKYCQRKVLVNFFASKSFKQVLFVENWDSYHQLIQKNPDFINDFALVYTAGFKASAADIRRSDCVSLHQSSANESDADAFVDWWTQSGNVNYPVYFWGDYDFSAMAILKALKQSFVNIQLWQPGYAAMYQQILKGRGHNQEYRQKQGQNDPVKTGCCYADEIVLPFLRESRSCYDQEGISFEPLKADL